VERHLRALVLAVVARSPAVRRPLVVLVSVVPVAVLVALAVLLDLVLLPLDRAVQLELLSSRNTALNNRKSSSLRPKVASAVRSRKLFSFSHMFDFFSCYLLNNSLVLLFVQQFSCFAICSKTAFYR
jgi:hypothetical protein